MAPNSVPRGAEEVKVAAELSLGVRGLFDQAEADSAVLAKPCGIVGEDGGAVLVPFLSGELRDELGVECVGLGLAYSALLLSLEQQRVERPGSSPFLE